MVLEARHRYVMTEFITEFMTEFMHLEKQLASYVIIKSL